MKEYNSSFHLEKQSVFFFFFDMATDVNFALKILIFLRMSKHGENPIFSKFPGVRGEKKKQKPLEFQKTQRFWKATCISVKKNVVAPKNIEFW